MQFTILLDDGTKIKGREFDKIEAVPSIAEEIVYTNNNFFIRIDWLLDYI